MSKNYRKRFRYILGWIFFKFFYFSIGVFPLRVVHKFSDFLGIMAYSLVKRFRKTSLESLDIAFGKGLSSQEKVNIAKNTMKDFMKLGLELLVFCRRPHLLKRYIHLEGKKYLDQALKEGKGVVGLTAHFGNFPLMCLKLASLGYKVNVMARPARDERMDREITSLREKAGVKTIYSYPRQRAVKESLEVLRGNEILVIQMDQHFGTGGVGVDFFGRKAFTAKGPVVFALRSGARVVPMFIIRDSRDSRFQKVIIEPPQELMRRMQNLEKTIINYVQEFTNLVEYYIRKYPDHWGWMHRRWKS